ncbi:MAG: GNAT family N-acetyltransferase [Vibrio sp.]
MSSLLPNLSYFTDQLTNISSQFADCGHRLLLPCQMMPKQAVSLISAYIQAKCQPMTIVCLEALPEADWHSLIAVDTGQDHQWRFLPKNQGKQVLGQDIDILICETTGLNPDSFNAACGALASGGMVIMLQEDAQPVVLSQIWLEQHLAHWPQLTADTFKQLTNLDAFIHSLSAINSDAQLLSNKMQLNSHHWHNFDCQVGLTQVTKDQADAFSAMQQLMLGRRKRPLVLTANRGRGKSSIIGIGLAQVLAGNPLHAILTAPQFASVETAFTHLYRQFDALGVPYHKQSKYKISLDNGAVVEFVAPDAIALNLPDADILIVDEAAAIPLPMLMHFVAHYHRLMLSSTMHGYEGCGRGFALKFLPWLQQQRSGMKTCHLTDPIRWSQSDPLEAWLFDTFLFDAKQAPTLTKPNLTQPTLDNLNLVRVAQADLIDKPYMLNHLFGLLISAHYQTTAKDLWQLLDDDALHIYQVQSQGQVIACVLCVEEGGLSRELSEQICLGQRRPPGHLVASLLSNQFGLPNIAMQRSLRVMRIAVAPDIQRQGLGQFCLNALIKQTQGFDFISTSFGATPELTHFWQKHFTFVYLGSRRDKASASYSACYVYPQTQAAADWVYEQSRIWLNQVALQAPRLWPDINPLVLTHLLCSVQRHLKLNAQTQTRPELNSLELNRNQQRILNYIQGGNCFESVAADINFYLIDSIEQMMDRLTSDEAGFVIQLILLQHAWQPMSSQFKLAGRKHVEAELKRILAKLEF